MADKFLTEDRFDRFEQKFDTYLEHRHAADLVVEKRITALETNQTHAAWIATWLSGVVATVVAAVILSWRRITG